MSGAAGFAVLLAAALALEVAGRRGTGPATVADAVGAAMRTTPGRVAVLLAWVWLGVHVLAR
ncbi:hypothetical protein SAMN05660209_00238 [Geodermatophilus africanus]|uniref:Uncharacterized protein n=1 Tax=Geodermatophilus africanus TaxID=1137993 RepID=A0A1H3AYN1_9ACTN|nr:DUF6186 family protein [Geodermatophilus africanus]SDX34797.1 hypothetical protein SAMN05660209_00238 [Geodermatophilus africanus]